MTVNKESILIIHPDEEMRSIMLEAFKEHGCPFSYEIAATVDEAQKILSQKMVHAIVMTKSVALSGDNGTNGLVTSQIDLPPTITLIQPGDGFPDYLYLADKIHDWVTVPFDLQELYNRVSRVIRRANKQSDEHPQIHPPTDL
jgi:DNA-binding response OmpR family regulator